VIEDHQKIKKITKQTKLEGLDEDSRLSSFWLKDFRAAKNMVMLENAEKCEIFDCCILISILLKGELRGNVGT